MEHDTVQLERACSIGAGRMGRALLIAARRAAFEAAGGWSRSTAGRERLARELRVSAPTTCADLVRGARVVFVAVPDAAIREVLAQLSMLSSIAEDDPLVVISSGCIRLEQLDHGALGALRIARMHPAQTVTQQTPPDVLDGVHAAITALDSGVAAAAAALALRLGMRPFDLADDAAPAWHASASIAAGGVTTLIAAARDLSASAGVPIEIALDAHASLARAAAEQARVEAPERSLTGPHARGDAATVAAHVEAIETQRPELAPLYRELGSLTTKLAGAR